MPARLAHLKLDDLPGISRGTLAKLHRAHVFDIPALYALDPHHARAIWRSIEGERFVRSLQGENIPLGETERGGYGNSKILSPENRQIKNAYLVGRWLVEKSCARMRRDARVAASFSVFASFGQHGRWGRRIRCEAMQDTSYFLALHRQLWVEMWRRKHPMQIMSVSVNLGNVSLLADRPGDLFAPLKPAEPSTRERLSAVVDMVNKRFGQDALTWGINRAHPGFFERG